MNAQIEGRITKTGSSSSMNIGDVAIILQNEQEASEEYVGHIILKTYNKLISLSNPEYTWSIPTNFLVEVLPKGTVIKLTV